MDGTQSIRGTEEIQVEATVPIQADGFVTATCHARSGAHYVDMPRITRGLATCGLSPHIEMSQSEPWVYRGRAVLYFVNPTAMARMPPHVPVLATLCRTNNADRRHHIPKISFKVQNWPEYEAGLRRR